MSINAFLQLGPTVVANANATAPSGVQVTCCGNNSATVVRLFNEDNANTLWYAYGRNAAEAKDRATLPTTGNMSVPLGPLASAIIRVNFPAPGLFFSAITRVSVQANLHITPGDGR